MHITIGISGGDVMNDNNNNDNPSIKNDNIYFVCMNNFENKEVGIALETLAKNKTRNKIISHEENSKIYAALKLIENLYKQGLIKKHVYKNILNDYNNCVDLSDFD